MIIPLLLLNCDRIPAETESIPPNTQDNSAYVWKLDASVFGAPDGTFTLDTVGDYITGMYGANLRPPLVSFQWCNDQGTGPGYQIKNAGLYTGNRPGWVYIKSQASAPGYYIEFCADSVYNDLSTTNISDSLKSQLRILAGSDIYIITGNNFAGSSMGYIYAIGCSNKDSTLLWSIADTAGIIHGPFTSYELKVDGGAWRFVREGKRPQCLP